MIVTEGKKQVAKLITGLQDNITYATTSGTRTDSNFRYIRVGNGGDSTSPSQTTLDNQVGDAKTSTPDLVGNTLVYTVTFTGADISSNTRTRLTILICLRPTWSRLSRKVPMLLIYLNQKSSITLLSLMSGRLLIKTLGSRSILTMSHISD